MKEHLGSKTNYEKIKRDLNKKSKWQYCLEGNVNLFKILDPGILRRETFEVLRVISELKNTTENGYPRGSTCSSVFYLNSWAPSNAGRDSRRALMCLMLQRADVRISEPFTVHSAMQAVQLPRTDRRHFLNNLDWFTVNIAVLRSYH